MSRTISMSDLKRVITESGETLDNFEITEDVIDEVLEVSGDKTHEYTDRLAREIARDAIEKALLTLKGGDFENEVGDEPIIRNRISDLATVLFRDAKAVIRAETDEENDTIDMTDGIPSEDDTITESEDGDIRTKLQELVDNGQLTWEELAGGLCDYLKDDELREVADANGWLNLDETVQIVDEKSSFGDPDEDDYVYEPDPSGELDLNGNPKMIKRAKGFGDDWKRVKGKVKGWFSRK